MQLVRGRWSQLHCHGNVKARDKALGGNDGEDPNAK